MLKCKLKCKLFIAKVYLYLIFIKLIIKEKFLFFLPGNQALIPVIIKKNQLLIKKRVFFTSSAGESMIFYSE